MTQFELRKRGCFDKKPYPTREAAQHVVDQRPHGKRLRVYECKEGGHFHLTSRRL